MVKQLIERDGEDAKMNLVWPLGHLKMRKVRRAHNRHCSLNSRVTQRKTGRFSYYSVQIHYVRFDKHGKCFIMTLLLGWKPVLIRILVSQYVCYHPLPEQRKYHRSLQR